MKPTRTAWLTRDGQLIRIVDMSDDHLANTIALLQRTARKVLETELEAAYTLSCIVRGEMAATAIEQDIGRLQLGLDDIEEWLCLNHTSYPSLIEEQARRGLA